MSSTSERDNLVNIIVSKQYAAALTEQLLKLNIAFKLEYQRPKEVQSSLPQASVVPSATIIAKNTPTALEVYIANNINKPIPSLNELAKELGLHQTKLREICRNTHGMTLYQFYMEKRMTHAAQLLKQGYKCNVVARMVGYGENSSIKFNKMFQKHFGITPKKYQMEHLKRGRK